MVLNNRILRSILIFFSLGTQVFAGDQNLLIDVTSQGEAFFIHVSMETPAKLQTAWAVLTDFDNMPAYVRNLSSSKIVRKHENRLLVQQVGVAKFGIFSFKFESEREIQLEPMRRISSTNLSGTAKSMKSESVLTPTEHGIKIKYTAEIVPDSTLAKVFGKSFFRHEIEEQFGFMLLEMKRRESI